FTSAQALIVSPLAAVSATANQNWPAWRGPLANGLAPAANPPTFWSETNNLKWKVKLPGSGTATPIIWGDQIFIQTAIATGKKPDAFIAKPESTAASAPLIVQHEGKAQVVSSATRKISRDDLTTGKQIWECAGLTPNVISTPV